MSINEDLLKKIKGVLIKAGFPLELSVAKTLKKDGWTLSLGEHYLDFETGKSREFDITAEKTINKTSIHLMIECKKSDKSQLILYSPSANKKSFLKEFNFSSWFKIFPKISQKGILPLPNRGYSHPFNDLNIFSKETILSKNLIFTQGNTILQDNVSFFSSLNGLIKKSVHTGTDGYNQTGFRIIYFYLVVYDGIMLQLLPSDSEDFDLNEIDYGQLEFEYNLKVLSEYKGIDESDIRSFGNKYIIEVLKPSFLEDYLKNINDTINGIDEEVLDEWGEGWPDLELEYIDEFIESKPKD